MEHKPSKSDLQAAANRTVADVIAPGLKVLFCGINPGLYSAAVGHHFARPGNRFWPALYAAGFTRRRLTPAEERELLADGYGITNVVRRASASAAELSLLEYQEGRLSLEARVMEYRPAVLAVLGIGAFRSAFNQPHAVFGEQDLRVGQTRVWVLPNPSGLNAHFTVEELADWLRKLKSASEA